MGSIARLCWGIAIAILVIAAIYSSVAREFVPLLVPGYKTDLENQLSDVLQAPIRIQAVNGEMVGFDPQFIISELQIGNQTTIKRIKIKVNVVGSVIAQKLRFEDVQIDSMLATFTQVENGWKLGDVFLPNNGNDDFSWITRLSNIHINQSQINIELINNKKFSIEKTNLKLNQTGYAQRVATDIVMPNNKLVTILAEGKGAWTDVNDMQWNIYANIPDIDWLSWIKDKTDDYVTIKKLQGGGQFWMQWREGKIDDVRIRANIPSFDWQYVSNQINDSVQAIHIDLVFQRQSDVITLSVPSLSFMWHEKAHSLGGWSLSKKNVDSRTVFSYEAKQLTMDSFLPIMLASQLLPIDTQSALVALKPSGSIENITAVFYSNSQNKLIDFTANGKLKHVSLDAWDGSPQVSGVNGSVEFTKTSGHLLLDSTQYAMAFPDLFTQGWQFTHAKGDLYWLFDDEKFIIRSGLLNLVNDRASVFGQFAYNSPHDLTQADHLGLQLGFRQVDAKYRMEYIPTKELDQSLSEWLEQAIVKGEVIRGAYLYDGAVSSDASTYAAQQLALDVKDVTLKFDESWPALENINGHMIYNNEGLRVDSNNATLLAADLNQITVNLPYDGNDLQISAHASGTAQTVMELLLTTPLHDEVGSALDEWKVDGAVTADIILTVPLDEKPTQVDVRSVLSNTQLTIPDVNLDFKNLQGDMRYSSSGGLNSQQLTAHATTFDMPVTVSIETPPKDKTLTARLRTKGKLPVEQLAAWQPSSLWSYVQGIVPYNVELQIPLNSASAKPVVVVVTSSLQGAAIKLPKPFGKTRNESRQLTATTLFNEKNYRIDARLSNEDVRGIALVGKNNEPPQANVYLGQTTSVSDPNASGMRVVGSTSNIIVEDWLAFINAEKKTAPQHTNSTMPPVNVDIRIGVLQGFDQTINDTQLRVNREGAAWKVELDSKMLSGNILFPDNIHQPYDVHVQHLQLPPSPTAVTTSEVKTDPLANVNPNDLPAMQIKIDDFSVGDDKYGKWYFILQPIKNGVDIKNIQIDDMKHFSIADAQGQWTYDKSTKQARSGMKGKLSTGNLNTALQAWGYTTGIDSQRATFDVDLSWPGSPALPSLIDGNGQIDFEFDEGRFSDISGKTGVLKIFGLMNLSAFTRRLTGDFRDLYQSGISYDTTKGSLRLENSIATFVNPMTIIGPSSDFKISGQTNLKTGEINQEIVVTPPVGQNATIIATILCGPACGGITYLIQKFGSQEINKFSSLKYKMTGTYENPKIEKETIFTKQKTTQ